MSEVVALLLDDAMPPERLGSLLRAARKRSGLKRKQAAAAAATTAARLRQYERGERPCPAAVCAQLAECYGDDLTAHVPLRVPVQFDGESLAIGDERTTVSDATDVLGQYIEIVRRLRSTRVGDPLALRTVDIVALAGALGRDREVIERQIAEVLGCSPTEARHLHSELLRRKVIVPVAGLAAGMVAFAGVAYAVQGPPTPAPAPAKSIVASAPATTARVRPAAITTPTVAPAPTTPTTTAQVERAQVERAQVERAQIERVPVERSTPPTTEVVQRVDATVPPADRTADVPDTVAPPQADPNDPPVSILPGETPITIIGTPDSTSETP